MPVCVRENDFSGIEFLVVIHNYSTVLIVRSKMMDRHSFPHKQGRSELPINSKALLSVHSQEDSDAGACLRV